MSTVNQFIAKEKKRIKEFQDGSILKKASIATNSMQVDRIFGKGRNSSGQAIGSYNSTDPIYVNPKEAPKSFPPKGKNGDTTFKSGKRHVTGYFPSYKAFRSNQGRQTGTIDLVLSSNLRSDYATPPEPIDPRTYLAGVDREENGKKIKGLEKRFGNIFNLTNQEQQFFFKFFLR